MRTDFGDGSQARGKSPNYDIERVEHEAWIACHICSFAIPLSEGVQHYRKGKLVCEQCADDFSHDDMMEFRQGREESLERSQPSPQPVQD